MIFLVNRLGDVNAISAPFIESLTELHMRELFKGCAWCPTWSGAAQLAHKRRRAVERLGLK